MPSTPDKPILDPEQAKELLGKHVLIGITYEDHNGVLVEQKQYHGTILRINDTEGIVIRLNGSNTDYTLPPDLRSFKKAPPGEYRLRSTGETVINPDYLTIWTINRPPPN